MKLLSRVSGSADLSARSALIDIQRGERYIVYTGGNLMAAKGRVTYIVLFTLIFGVIAFFAGYLIFGRFLGEHLAFKDLFAAPKGILGEIGQSLTGIKTARQNIFITTGAGAVAGFFLALILRRR